MIKIVFKIVFVFVSLLTGAVWAHNEPAKYPSTIFNLRKLKVEINNEQIVTIPSKFFKVAKTLQESLDFEVGGGLDFNLSKEFERAKLSFGEEDTITFLPDFEIAWHTHPVKTISPPSHSDLEIALVGSYNLYLALNKKLNSNFSNAIELENFEVYQARPYMVNSNIIFDKDGVYVYKADLNYWRDIWKSNSREKIKKIIASKGNIAKNLFTKIWLNAVVNNQDNKVVRENILSTIEKNLNMEIKFYPIDELVKNGLEVKLDIVELIKK